MADFCNDNRFELIEKYKKKLIEETNIESAPDEMKVLNNILFRFWQMGWLDKLEQTAQPERKNGKWIKHPEWQADGECAYECDQCGMGSDVDYDFCMRCGADMREGEE